MNKAYDKVTWVNKPSTASPLNQTNLNKMSDALDIIDDRVIALDNGKVSSVTVTNTLPDGDTIATITVDGTPTNIKSAQVEVDDTPSATSENPLQNKAIYEMLNNLLPEETVQGNPIAISDASGLNAKACSVDLLPIQDLHGYDSPWVGGAGKNKLNATGTQENCTLADGVYTLNSVPSTNANFVIGTVHLAVGDYKINGGYDNNFRININVGGTYYTSKGDDVAFSIATEGDYQVIGIILATATAGKQIKPMIRSSSVSDETFAPYENICPISGRTQASVNRGSVDITTLYNGQIESTGAYTGNTKRICNVNNTQMNTCFLKKGTHTLTFKKLNQNAPNLVECTVLTKNDNFEIVDNFATAWHSLPYTFELTADAYVYFTARKDFGTILNTADYKALIIDETYTETLGQPVYGGNVDFVSGKLTIDKYIYTITGDEAWNRQGTSNKYYTTQFIFRELGALLPTDNYSSVPIITSIGSFNYSYVGLENHPYSMCIAGDGRIGITADLKKESGTLQGVQICYTKRVPSVITLTEQQIDLLKGANVLWSDSNGNIKLTYSADIKAWVENQLSNS